MLRKLRIAFSAMCGIVCLLLIALWVRSYTWADIISGRLISIQSFQAISCHGKIAVIIAPYKGAWQYEGGPAQGYLWRRAQYENVWLFASTPRTNNRHELIFSYLFLGLFPAVIAPLPWLPPRFSLRTLLIATMVVAVVLGMIFGILR